MKEELASADTRAQVAEWDNQELRLEVEELKEKVRRGFRRSAVCSVQSTIEVLKEKYFFRPNSIYIQEDLDSWLFTPFLGS